MRVHYDSMHKFDYEELREFKIEQRSRAFELMKRLKYRLIGKFEL